MHNLLTATALALALGLAGPASSRSPVSSIAESEAAASTSKMDGCEAANQELAECRHGFPKPPEARAAGEDPSAISAAAGGRMTGAGFAAAPAETTRSSTAAAAGSSAAANAMTGMKAQELIGREVVNTAGKEVGEIDDVVIDDRDKALYVVVGVGGIFGFGEKDVAIPFDQLRLGADNVILMSEKGQGELKGMPAYKKGQWKSLDRGQFIEAR